MAMEQTVQAPADRRHVGVQVSAQTWGAVAGLLAVVAGSFFAVRPPEAYGICMACHGRDLIDWGINHLLGTELTVAGASAVFPLLTTVGVLLGAVVAAVTSGEFHWQTPDNPLKTFVYGLLVMNCALLAAGCSIRLALRAAAGELLGMAGFAAFVAGTALATVWLKRRALR
ncbi:MAG: YeeE/YedE family protein [Ardenticatenaceae bacterium]|nr:YeeE/YedE family protein [Ardenticatenaceae bacterium]